MKPEANFIGSVNDRGTDAFRNSSMEERKEERKKKLFVPRIRVGSFKLLNIDARRDQVLVREKGEKNFLNPFFFFPLLNRQNAFPHFPCSQRDYLSLPLPRFFLFLFFSSRWNVNRSKVSYEIKETLPGKFSLHECFHPDCPKTLSNFVLLAPTTNDAFFSHVGLPLCRTPPPSSYLDCPSRFFDTFSDDEWNDHHRAYYSYIYL